MITDSRRRCQDRMDDGFKVESRKKAELSAH
jgi:hypothetical protein